MREHLEYCVLFCFLKLEIFNGDRVVVMKIHQIDSRMGIQGSQSQNKESAIQDMDGKKYQHREGG